MYEKDDIIQEYFAQMAQCASLNCQKVIFEPQERREWFFEEDSWCCFEFSCDDEFYMLKKDDNKIFSDDCIIKEMSYEIKMLLGFVRLRKVSGIDKTMFATYVDNYEKEKLSEPNLSIEKYNYEVTEKEGASYEKADRIANGIMGGCFVLAVAVGFLFLFAVFAYLKMRFFN